MARLNGRVQELTFSAANGLAALTYCSKYRNAVAVVTIRQTLASIARELGAGALATAVEGLADATLFNPAETITIRMEANRTGGISVGFSRRVGQIDVDQINEPTYVDATVKAALVRLATDLGAPTLATQINNI